MNIYTWLAVLLLLTGLLMRGNAKGSKKFILIAFLLLFCVIGLRDVYSVGCDSTSSYLHRFEDMETADWSELSGRGEENFNIGFSYLLKLGYIITKGDYQLFIAIISAFMMIAHAHFVKRYSPSPLQSILYFWVCCISPCYSTRSSRQWPCPFSCLHLMQLWKRSR